MSAVWLRLPTFASTAARDAYVYNARDIGQWVTVSVSPPAYYLVTSVSSAGVATFAPLGRVAVSLSTPGDPTGTTDTTGKMAGLACSITPVLSGRIEIVVTGDMTNATGTAGNGAKAQIRYGTGTAPTNGANLTGSTTGNMVTGTLMRAASDLVPFCCVGQASNLVLGTAVWVDLQQVALVAGTGQLKNLTVSIKEL